MTNENKKTENDSYSNSLEIQESFCSECKNEMAQIAEIDQNQDEDTPNNKSFCSSCRSEVVTDETQNGGILMKFFHEKIVCSKCKNKAAADEHQNPEDIDKNCSDSEKLINELFAEALNDNEELLQATQSLSQISLSYPIEKEENQSNNPTHLGEDNLLSNEINANEYKNIDEENDVSLYNDHDDELHNIEVGEKNLASQNYDDNATSNIFENINDNSRKIFFCDQEVQTEVESTNKENEPMWDPEFPSGMELEQIDNAVREATITPASKCKRKLNFDDIGSNFKIAKKSKDVSKPNVNAMISTKFNRDKYLADLANDLYELSTYLNDIGKAMNVKESNNKTSMKIPPAPKIVGYDIQFDCLNQSRFSKLPITIENNDSNKFNGSHESLNSKQRVKALSKKSSNSALSLKNVKATNNSKGVGVPKKSFYQTTLKEAFSYGKENRNIQNSNTGSKKILHKINLSHNINEDNKSLDSTSMYDFNPLRSSTFSKKK
ncbi:uncharacterized protein [Chelonus insularis]|uniref:uncharacterized protein n=1 Tax=Chelonus insularis TaxID=460826 RepID=UPI00158E93B9|nr:uncharacterized protein LOC118069827 [Chelonus insularis]